jgi:hypothetical protein
MKLATGIGLILKDLRKQGKFGTDFASESVGIQASMVRMIEAGHADVPVARISAYAMALSTKGVVVNPEELARAYASLRSRGSRNILNDRFEWDSLMRVPYGQARKRVEELLTQGGADFKHEQAELTREFGSLNPVQLQLVREIAKRVQAFGSSVVTDDAIAAWESANATRIVGIRAAVTSLASERKATYVESIGAMASSANFKWLRYLIAADAKSPVDAVWKALQESVSASLPAGRSSVVDKLEYRRIDLEEYRALESAMTSITTGSWDALYAYEFESGPTLMIGTFRRLPLLTEKVEPPSLTDWRVMVMGETLPMLCANEFVARHEQLWAVRDRRREKRGRLND